MLNSPLKSHKNKPFSKRKIAITKYPMGEAKKEFISFLKIANIYFKVSSLSTLQASGFVLKSTLVLFQIVLNNSDCL